MVYKYTINNLFPKASYVLQQQKEKEKKKALTRIDKLFRCYSLNFDG